MALTFMLWEFSELLVILFKDIITAEKYPVFFILCSNKREELYILILNSIKRILSQNNIYDIKLDTITSDQEKALINSIEIVFPNIQLIFDII